MPKSVEQLPETAPPDLARPARGFWWWFRLWLVVVVLLGVAAPVGYLAWLLLQAPAYVELLRYTDRVDPGWRWEDLQAKRTQVPDEANAALVINKALKALSPGPGRWMHILPTPWEARFILPTYLPPWPQQPILGLYAVETFRHPVPALLGEMRKACSAEAAALAELATLHRFPIGVAAGGDFGIDGFAFSGSIVQDEWLRLILLLRYDLERCLAEDDAAGAVRDLRAMFVLANANGDVADSGRQLLRAVTNMWAVQALERALALREFDAGFLAELQTGLAKERRLPTTLAILRGERAFQVGSFEYLLTGRLRGKKISQNWGERVRLLFMRGSYSEMLRDYLQTYTPTIEKLKEDASEHAVGSLLTEFRKTQEGRSLGKARYDRSLQASLANAGRNQALLACAEAALACERFRLATGNWPQRLQDLVPQYLAKVPVDPLGQGQPIRMTQRDGALVVYSVDADGADDGGRIVPEIIRSWLPETMSRSKVTSDLGFSLWPSSQRGRPAVVPADFMAF
jgi:hypothetical protein